MIKSSLRGIPLVNRESFIVGLARKKSVLHLGATDAPFTQQSIGSNRLLHVKLAMVARELVGVDNNKQMIELLRDLHGIGNIHFGDIESSEGYPPGTFDVVVAGEILEHLSNSGRTLDALHLKMTKNSVLVVTVPNAYSVKGLIRALVGFELIHPDHVLHHSPHTLKCMLARHGFEVERMVTFINGGCGPLATLTNYFLRFFPQLAEGIAVVCRTSSAGSKYVSAITE